MKYELACYVKYKLMDIDRSADSDKMPQSTVSDQGLYCLQKVAPMMNE